MDSSLNFSAMSQVDIEKLLSIMLNSESFNQNINISNRSLNITGIENTFNTSSEVINKLLPFVT